MPNTAESSDFPDLPDREFCRTEPFGAGTTTLYLCRTLVPCFCRYALSFGYATYFCTHDDRADLARNGATGTVMSDGRGHLGAGFPLSTDG